MPIRALFKVEDTEFQTTVELEAVPRTGETVVFGERSGEELEVGIGEVLEVSWNIGAREPDSSSVPHSSVADIEILVRLRR